MSINFDKNRLMNTENYIQFNAAEWLQMFQIFTALRVFFELSDDIY